MTLDFDNDEQYKAFVTDVATAVVFDSELADDIANEIVYKPNYLDELARAVLNRLLAYQRVES